MRLPKTNVVVDVVDIGEDRRGARDEARGAARNSHGGEIRRELRNEVPDTGFVGMSFQIKESGNLCARLDVSRPRAERCCGEWSKDGAMVCIKHHESVVIRRAVIRRVERGDLDRVALTARAEGLEIRLEHGTKRRVTRSDEIRDGLGWCGAEACRG